MRNLFRVPILELATGIGRPARSLNLSTSCANILDEAAFMRSDTSASPDTELYAALRPGMLTIPRSRMVIISSPYRRSGLLWNRYNKFFGVNDPNVLVIQASVRQLNPTITEAQLDAEREEDPAAAISELDGQFRDDIAAFLSLTMIEDATDRGVIVRAPQPGISYSCGVDPSGGVSDFFTAAVSHADKAGNIVLDALIEIKAPFHSDLAVERVVDLMKSYGINACVGDHYSAGFVVAAFARHNVTYRHSEKDSKQDLRGRAAALHVRPRSVTRHGEEPPRRPVRWPSTRYEQFPQC